MAEFALKDMGAGCFHVEGELTFATVAKLVNVLDPCFSNNPVVLDLSDVGQSDSSSLALLMEWERSALSRNIELRYTGLPQQLESMVRLSGLTDVLPLVDS